MSVLGVIFTGVAAAYATKAIGDRIKVWLSFRKRRQEIQKQREEIVFNANLNNLWVRPEAPKEMKTYEAGVMNPISWDVRWTGIFVDAFDSTDADAKFADQGFYKNLIVREVHFPSTDGRK